VYADIPPGGPMINSDAMLTPEEKTAIEDRQDELRHLEKIVAELDLSSEWLRIEIEGPAQYSNTFAVWLDFYDEDPELMGREMSFTSAAGFVRGVEATLQLYHVFSS
jgi:hypothetical protein